MTILLMAKAPRPGYSKTRLCPPCTPEQAAEVAAASLSDTLDAMVATGLPVVVALDGTLDSQLPDGVEHFPQVGTTFSERLAHAWSCVSSPAIQIGMDTPQVTAELLLSAYYELRDSSSVLGFAEDGGWWAIGFSQPPEPDMFSVPMSEPDTGARQRDQLLKLGHTPTELLTLRDVDTWNDAIAIAESVPAGRLASCVARIADEISG